MALMPYSIVMNIVATVVQYCKIQVSVAKKNLTVFIMKLIFCKELSVYVDAVVS